MDERAAQLEAASTNHEALRTQISHIRETVQRILHEDRTLSERIRTLFLEQGHYNCEYNHGNRNGYHLVFAITAGAGEGAGGVPTVPSPPTAKAGLLKEWVKYKITFGGPWRDPG